MKRFVVTFARGFGSGGKEIASILAHDLGIHCYENRILTLASQLSGLDEKLFNEVNEKIRSNGGFRSMMRGLPRSRNYIAKNEKFVSDDKLFEYQCVLRSRENVVSIYIEAPRAFCRQRVIEHLGVTPEVADATITQTDKYRADYYAYYTHGNYWTNPVNYDMTLNSEKVGIRDCVKIIEQFLILKGYITEDEIGKKVKNEKK